MADVELRVLDIFRHADRDGDGIISREDLSNLLKLLGGDKFDDRGIDRMMSLVDTNRDGRIQYCEFVRWVMGGARFVGVAQGAEGGAWPGGARAEVRPGSDLPASLRISFPAAGNDGGVQHWALGGVSGGRSRIRILEDPEGLLKLGGDTSVALRCRVMPGNNKQGFDSLLLGHDNKHWLAVQSGHGQRTLCCLDGMTGPAAYLDFALVEGQWADFFILSHIGGPTEVLAISGEGLVECGRLEDVSLEGSTLRSLGWATGEVQVAAFAVWGRCLTWEELGGLSGLGSLATLSLSESPSPEPAAESPSRSSVVEPPFSFDRCLSVGLRDGALLQAQEAEDRVVLPERPEGLELGPVEDGRGAIVQKVDATSATAGICEGATLLSIDDTCVQDMPTHEVVQLLATAPLPMTLSLARVLTGGGSPASAARGRDPVTVCTASCRGTYKVVKHAVQHLGWRELRAAADTASVIWVEFSDRALDAAPVQTVSRIEPFLHACKKAPLAESLGRWDEELPEAFAFSPKSWVLPEDAAALRAVMGASAPDEVFIAKPTDGAQGKGITLASRWAGFEAIAQGRKEHVVQRYLSKPLLLDGMKFDMRLYAVITSIVPLRAYIFRDGLARFCTTPYEAPNEENMKDTRMHITNHATNLKNKKVVNPKRPVSLVLRQIQEVYGYDPEDFWQKVATISANTFMAMRPDMLEFYVYGKHRPLHPLAPKGFQIIGLDIMLDSDMVPYLLEINANPALSLPKGFARSGVAATSPPPDEADERAVQIQRHVRGRQTRRAVAAKRLAAPPARSRGSDPNVSRPNSARRPSSGGRAPSSPQSRSSPRGRRTSRAGGEAEASPRQASPRQASPRQASPRERSAPAAAEDGASEAGELDDDVAGMAELEVTIKRELVGQALLLVRPAPMNKVARLKKQWAPHAALTDLVPLNDDGSWALDAAQKRCEEAREDAPERSPALVAVDLEALAAPEVRSYAEAHLQLCRTWAVACDHDPEKMTKDKVAQLMQAGGLVGPAAGAVFADAAEAEAWLAAEWPGLARGGAGLDFPAFLSHAARLGARRLPAGRGASLVRGVLAFAERGLYGPPGGGG